MGWYIDRVRKVKGLDDPMFVLFVFSKVLGGVAIGILIAPYVGTVGWWVLAAAIIVAIPVLPKLFKKS